MEDKNDNDDDAGACLDNRYGTATLALGNPNLEKATLNWGEALVTKTFVFYTFLLCPTSRLCRGHQLNESSPF